MLAHLKDDIIIRVGLTSGGVEIGSLPKGIGLDRLRWDGYKLIDLDKVDTIYIGADGTFHCISLPETQAVKMSYRERRALIKVGGRWKVLSKQEQAEKHQKDKENILSNKRRKNYPNIGDQLDAILKYLSKKDDLPNELKGIINQWQDTKIKLPKRSK